MYTVLHIACTEIDETYIQYNLKCYPVAADFLLILFIK